MSCECEHKRMATEADRVRRLAKALARMEEAVAVVYRNEDGTYGFCTESEANDKDIVEYITPY